MPVNNWPAPAKLNLFLHITGRRADGYHELQTLFQFVELGDQLRFEITEHSDIQLQNPLAGVDHDNNLCVRAARILQQHTNTRQGVSISLEKRLPMGGGLGGGSSDAATCLCALNQLWHTRLSTDELCALGLQLGADVPVFIRGQAAWAEGIGEQLTIVTDLPEPWFLIIDPKVQVPTAPMYAMPELQRNCPRVDMSAYRAGQCGNVFEAVVKQHFPAVAEALQWLNRYGSAHMTGSGACVFAAFERQQDAEHAFNDMPNKWTGYLTKASNQSTLKKTINSI